MKEVAEGMRPVVGLKGVVPEGVASGLVVMRMEVTLEGSLSRVTSLSLAVRILGDITREKVRILQDADDIFINGLRNWKVPILNNGVGNVQSGSLEEGQQEVSLYDLVWQAGVVLTGCMLLVFFAIY